MKVGIIGPLESIELIDRVISKHYKSVEAVQLRYSDYKQAADITKKHQRELDGILFTGPTPFQYASQFITPLIPWEFMPRDGSSLLATLLEVFMLRGYNILNMSFDSYACDLLYETYEEIGIAKEQTNFYIAEKKIFDQNYTEYVYQFHKEHYQSGKVSCCITRLADVSKRLREDNIPCVKVKFTSNSIRMVFNKLKLKHLAQINQSNQIVVLAVEIDLPHENSIVHYDEYQMALKKMKISERIYLFAQKVQAAVVELYLGSYLIFSTRSILESETNNLRQFDLMDMDSSNMSSTVSIGIGYGRTAREAKYGANLGKERAKKCGGNRIFVVYEGEKIIGPINELKHHNQPQDRIDHDLLEIAEKSGLGKDAVYKLYSIVKQYRLDTVTPKELARIYGITLRSMNRIILKLQATGYIKTVGKKSTSDFGRPSRVIKIDFNL